MMGLRPSGLWPSKRLVLQKFWIVNEEKNLQKTTEKFGRNDKGCNFATRFEKSDSSSNNLIRF
jgi:hypothetical protein